MNLFLVDSTSSAVTTSSSTTAKVVEELHVESKELLRAAEPGCSNAKKNGPNDASVGNWLAGNVSTPAGSASKLLENVVLEKVPAPTIFNSLQSSDFDSLPVIANSGVADEQQNVLETNGTKSTKVDSLAFDVENDFGSSQSSEIKRSIATQTGCRSCGNIANVAAKNNPDSLASKGAMVDGRKAVPRCIHGVEIASIPMKVSQTESDPSDVKVTTAVLAEQTIKMRPNQTPLQKTSLVNTALQKDAQNADEDLAVVYRQVCDNAQSVIVSVRQWKVHSLSMPYTDLIFDASPEQSCDGNAKIEEMDVSSLDVKQESTDVSIMPCSEEKLPTSTSSEEKVEIPTCSIEEVVPASTCPKEHVASPTGSKQQTLTTACSIKKAPTSLCSEARAPLLGCNEGSFSNSLDILAMVASGYFNQNMVNEYSEDSQGSSVSQQHEAVPDIETPEKTTHQNASLHVENYSDPPLETEPDELMKNDQLCPSVDASSPAAVPCSTSQVYPVASYLCDGSLLQLNYARHPDNVKLFREVWTKGKVRNSFLFAFMTHCCLSTLIDICTLSKYI